MTMTVVEYMILRLYLAVFSVVLVSIEKIYQTFKFVKNTPLRVIF